MKKRSLLLLVLIGLLWIPSAIAQENVPKAVFLNTINGVNELKMSDLKTSQLMEYNEGYADKVYDILDGDKADKDKTSALKTLNTSKEKDLEDLLGKDFKKYRKLMEESLKPLIKKNKMFKNLL